MLFKGTKLCNIEAYLRYSENATIIKLSTFLSYETVALIRLIFRVAVGIVNSLSYR